MQSDLFHCKVILHVSGVTSPIIRSTETVTATSGTGHDIGTATSLQRGQIGTSPDLEFDLEGTGLNSEHIQVGISICDIQHSGYLDTAFKWALGPSEPPIQDHR